MTVGLMEPNGFDSSNVAYLYLRGNVPSLNTAPVMVFIYREILSTLKADASLSCYFNPLKAELNPICCLLALLGAHHFLNVSRIRVKLLTFRRLM